MLAQKRTARRDPVGAVPREAIAWRIRPQQDWPDAIVALSVCRSLQMPLGDRLCIVLDRSPTGAYSMSAAAQNSPTRSLAVRWFAMWPKVRAGMPRSNDV